MGAIRIETSGGAQAISIMLLCLSIEETLKDFMAGTPLSKEDKVVLKEGRKFFSQIVMGSLTETFADLRANSSLIPPEQIDLFESFTPFEYAQTLLGSEDKAIRFSRENASLINDIENVAGSSRDSFTQEKESSIRACEDFFATLWAHIDEQIEGSYI